MGVINQPVYRFRIAEGNTIAFEVREYDKDLLLVIDPPTRLWGTYYGGSDYEFGNSVAVDGSGNVYLAGYTGSDNAIATSGAHQTTYGGGDCDAFLVKLNSNCVRQWGTYYGGNDYDYGKSVTVDGSNNVYLAGWTRSSNAIATSGAHQTTYGGSYWDAFLVKFNSSGVRQWGTYYGGSSNDYGNSVAFDGSGNVYLGGTTGSSNAIATSGAHQTQYRAWDAFLAKISHEDPSEVVELLGQKMHRGELVFE